MDIKFVNPNLVTPRKTPVQAVKPAIKYANPAGSPSAKSESVRFSDLAEQEYYRSVHDMPSM